MKPLPKVGELVPDARQVTGGRCYHTAYVVEFHGVVLEACQHKHRTRWTALACADRMVRARKRAAA